MIKRLSVFFLLCLALASCDPTTRKARRMRDQAMLCLETNPDSTLLLIDSMMQMETRFSEDERMELALLQGKAMYENLSCSEETCRLADRVVPLPELDHAPAYFAKKKRYEKAAVTALYNGYTSLNVGDKASAMRAFKDAEQYGLLALDTLTMARARYRMGKTLYNDAMTQEAISMLKASCLGFKEHPVETALAQNVLACCYMLRHDFDSAAYCLEGALAKAESANCTVARRKVLNNYAVLFRLKGDFDSALCCLRQVLADHDSTTLPLNYLNFGNTYVAMGELDSAAFYYDLTLQLINDNDVKNETRVAVYQALTHFAELKGDNAKALNFRKQYDSYLVKVYDQREKEHSYYTTKKYDYQTLRESMSQTIAKEQRLIAIICGVLMLVLIVVWLLLNRLAKKRKEEAETNAKLFQALEKECFFKVQTKLLVNGERTAKQLANVVFDQSDCWTSLLASIEKLYPNLWETQLEMFPELSLMEQKVLMLSRFKLSRQDEAGVLGISVSVLDKLRGQVRKKTKKLAKSLDSCS